MPRLYIAGPLFNTHERWYLEQIASALETACYTTYLPLGDAGIIDTNQPLDRVRLFRADLAGLNQCDACVALLTGLIMIQEPVVNWAICSPKESCVSV